MVEDFIKDRIIIQNRRKYGNYKDFVYGKAGITISREKSIILNYVLNMLDTLCVPFIALFFS